MLRYIACLTAVIMMMTSCAAGKPASDTESENTANVSDTADTSAEKESISETQNNAENNGQEIGEETNSADDEAQTEFYPQSKYTDFECRTEAKDDAVSIDLDTVSSESTLTEGVACSDGVITVSKGGDYILSGTYNGRIVINTPDEKTHLILNGVTLSADMSPICIEDADKVSLTLVDGTVNTVSDSANYTFEEGEDDPDAAIFSREALSINGNGTLVVNGNYDKGIFSKDSLKIISGTISVTSVGDAVKGKDYLLVKDGSITINAGEDGLKSNKDDNSKKGYVIIEGGDIKITCGDDGIHAETYLIVHDGNIDIEKCYEGLEGAKVEIHGGVINVNASDDALNAASGSSSNEIGFDKFDKSNMNFPDRSNTAGGDEEPPEMPDGFSPDNMPDDFDPSSIPDGNDRPEMPDGFSPDNMPDDFDPDNIPDDSDRPEMPDGFSPDNMPDDFDPSSIPDDSNRPEMPNDTADNGGMGGKGGFGKRGDGGFGGFGGGNSFGEGNNFNEPAEEGVYLLITGGEITLTGGNDVIDSNGTFTQTGGSVTINNPNMSVYGEPDCIIDVNGDAVISGGDFIANAGREGSASEVFTTPHLSFSMGRLSGSYTVTDQSGSTVLTGEAVGASVIVIASDKLTSGAEYTLTIGDKTITAAAE